NWMGRARFEKPPGFFVDGRNAHVNGASARVADVEQDVPISDDHRPFRHETNRRPSRCERFEAPSRQLVVPFNRLVRIGGGGGGGELAGPRRATEVSGETVAAVA